MGKGIIKYGLLYGIALAAIAVVLQWIEFRFLALSMPVETYIGLIAFIFIAIGVWAGMRLTSRAPAADFEPNDKAIASLGLTPRECEVLDHLAKGASNKEIARVLDVSPNTVKTHVASLYAKLEVNGRGKAVDAARALALIR